MYFMIILSLVVFATFSYGDSKLYTDGEVLVKFKRNANQISIIKQSGGEVKEAYRSLNLYRVKLKSGISVYEAIEKLKKNPDVEYAEPNYIVRKMETFPNDPYFDIQWGLRAINMPKVWDVCRGTEVIVAVLDSGVDYNHPDLKANLWKNDREICDNGKDDDGNGFIDDCYGWNFAYNNNDVMDDDTDSHGTHVAGIIGAVGNNRVGISGINWHAKIMPVKFLNADGSSDIATVIKAIDYAVMMGAKIINASYGYPDGCGIRIAPSKAEEEAIKKARDAGVLFVSAAGNFRCNNDLYPFYPASYKLDNVIAVAAVDQGMNLSRLSNYGRNSVHIAMPGVNIFSTVRTSVKGGYDYKSGTSMATPFMSGLAAMLMGCRGFNYLQTKEAILSTASKKQNLTDYTISGGIADGYAAISYRLPASSDITAFYPNTNTSNPDIQSNTASNSSGCSTGSQHLLIAYLIFTLLVSTIRLKRTNRC